MATVFHTAPLNFTLIQVSLNIMHGIYSVELNHSVTRLNFTLIYLLTLFLKFTIGDSLQGRLEKRLNALYDGVQTFVLFIGHARSGHSLIGAILDAHPEIIIPHEYNVIDKWHDYKNKSSGMSDQLKTRLFFDMHSRSQYQAMFENRSSSRCSDDRYCYNVPGQWQGTYRDRIKV